MVIEMWLKVPRKFLIVSYMYKVQGDKGNYWYSAAKVCNYFSKNPIIEAAKAVKFAQRIVEFLQEFDFTPRTISYASKC